jgi:DNA-binding NarL/FixJ family response regulator
LSTQKGIDKTGDSSITIGIIEDNQSLRLSLCDYIEMDNDLLLLFSYNSIEKWLAHLEQYSDAPDMLFLDIGLPGISGLKAISVIKKAYPITKLIVISGDSSEDSVWEAITNGANGYLLKPFSLKDFKQQINIINTGGAAISPLIAEKLIRSLNNNIPVENKNNSLLTARENHVLEQLIKGLTYKEIANILRISLSTVNDHIKNIYIKMKVNSKTELVAKVLSNNIPDKS